MSATDSTIFDCGAEGANLLDRGAGLHDNSVSSFRCHLLSNRSVARDVDRYQGAGRWKTQSTPVEGDDFTMKIDCLAAQQRTDHCDCFAHRTRWLPAINLKLGKPGNPGADAKYRATARYFVKGGDRHCRERRMSRVRIGHAGSDEDLGRVRGNLAKAGIDFTVKPLVR